MKIEHVRNDQKVIQTVEFQLQLNDCKIAARQTFPLFDVGVRRDI